jgi:hypothetical protein
VLLAKVTTVAQEWQQLVVSGEVAVEVVQVVQDNQDQFKQTKEVLVFSVA